MNKNTKLNIIMIGPDLSVKGGISFVVKEYLNSGLDRLVSLKFIPSHKDGSSFYKIGIFIKAFFKYLLALFRTPASIIHLHVSKDGSFVRKLILFCLGKIFRKKMIIHLHADFEIFMNKSKVSLWLTRYMFNKANYILVLYNQLEKVVSDFINHDNIITLYNPVALKCRDKKKYWEFIKVLLLGRLGKNKGVYDLLECIKQNKNYFESHFIKFILAGDGDVENVRAILKRNCLESIVDVPGWVSGDKKMQYLISSHIMILPTHNEQMPMSILEGMAYGYPIVATSVAGIPEMVEQGSNGLLFEPGDIDAMFSGLKQLCEHRELRERMGTRSIEIVKEKFESNMITHKLVDIYYKVSGEELKE